MIDTSKKAPIPLSKAARMLPSSRTDYGLDVSTLHRWSRRGIRGHKLEVIHLGGTACTSQEALGRFFAAIARTRDESIASCPTGAPSGRWSDEVVAKGKLDRPSRKRNATHDPRVEPPKNAGVLA